MSNINFKSTITLTSPTTFFNKVCSIGKRNFVDSPWTVKQSVFAPSAFTTDVFDCTTLGLSDGQKVLLLHICPTNIQNANLKKIQQYIENKIDLTNEYLQGFILGGKYNNIHSPKSIRNFEFFENIFKKFNIPYSAFKGGNYTNHVAYSSVKDEWLIANALLENDIVKNKTPEEAAKFIFDNIKIADCDELKINTFM